MRGGYAAPETDAWRTVEIGSYQGLVAFLATEPIFNDPENPCGIELEAGDGSALFWVNLGTRAMGIFFDGEHSWITCDPQGDPDQSVEFWSGGQWSETAGNFFVNANLITQVVQAYFAGESVFLDEVSWEQEF
jgi:hypothetical protein